MRRFSIQLFAVLFLCSAKLHAQCDSEQKILKDIQDQYNVLFVDLEKQGELLKKQVPDSSDTGFKSPNPHFGLMDWTPPPLRIRRGISPT